MEALETVINFWEDALVAYESPTTPEESEFCREIQSLLDLAWQLQDQSELLFLDQRSILFRNSSHANDKNALHRSMSDPNFDSAESFASALDQVLLEIYLFSFSLFQIKICWKMHQMRLADSTWKKVLIVEIQKEFFLHIIQCRFSF